MIFLMIVPPVMIVTIILVHETARYFGKEISYFSLIICAVLSFLVDAVAVAISTAANIDYFLKLFILIFVAAAVVTAVNRFLEVKK